MRFLGAGHVVFALTLIGVGILGLVQGDFVQIWQPVPKSFPLREALIWLCAAISLACGAGLFWRRTAVPSARVLFFYLLAWMPAFKLRFILLAPLSEGSYQSNGENAVIVAGAWVLYVLLASGRGRRHPGFFSGDSGLRAARMLYGLAMIAFGLSHFFYLDLTAPLVPAGCRGTQVGRISPAAPISWRASRSSREHLPNRRRSCRRCRWAVHVPGVVAAGRSPARSPQRNGANSPFPGC